MAAQEENHDRERLCKRCGRSFICRVETVENCQCNTVSLQRATLEFLTRTEWGCLCADCLTEIDLKVSAAQGKIFPGPGELKEGIHYYIEKGFWVFTEYYHMLRGHCCRSGCRHCAYGYKKPDV